MEEPKEDFFERVARWTSFSGTRRWEIISLYGIGLFCFVLTGLMYAMPEIFRMDQRLKTPVGVHRPEDTIDAEAPLIVEIFGTLWNVYVGTLVAFLGVFILIVAWLRSTR